MRIECEPVSFIHDSTWPRAMASLIRLHVVEVDPLVRFEPSDSEFHAVLVVVAESGVNGNTALP